MGSAAQCGIQEGLAPLIVDYSDSLFPAFTYCYSCLIYLRFRDLEAANLDLQARKKVGHSLCTPVRE